MTHEYMTSAELSREIKKRLDAAAPQCKWSVTKSDYSGGRSVKVALMAAPFAVFADEQDEHGATAKRDGYAQLNHYSFRPTNARNVEVDGYCSNGVRLTAKAWKVLKMADQIANARNYDNSDPMTDYFDVNFYFDLHVGKWNKPFEQIAA